MFKICFTSPYIRLCIGTVIAIISSISLILLLAQIRNRQYTVPYSHEGTSEQPRSRDSIAGRLNERTDNATFPNHIKAVCLDLTRKVTVVYVSKTRHF